jgi:DHA1 family bicyclomycin/chloramphenicol resistance-like MFS transporter
VGQRELIGLLSMVMALAALGIDMMLPAFVDMRRTFDLAAGSNEIARTITAYFVGMATAPVLYGALADRFGRKPVLYLGGTVYLIGAVGSALAPTLPALLAARFVWGIGAAGGRVVAMAIIRDTHQGEEMARTMSYIMSVFILVPVFAPSLGAVVVSLGSWRWVFGVTACAAAAILAWSLRLNETLDPANRQPIRWGRLGASARRLASTPATVVPTLALTCLMGIMATYLASSPLLVGEVFDREDQFPIVFGAVALVLGGASFLNGRLVGRFGIRRLLGPVAVVYLVAGLTTVALSLGAEGRPAFWVFMPVLTVTLGCQMLLVPSLNTLAMEPVGDIAGTAAAVIGSVSTAGGAVIGSIVDSRMTSTTTPLAMTVGLAGATVGVLVWAMVRSVPVPVVSPPAPVPPRR